MKQHISIKQLNELSEKQKKVLLKLSKPIKFMFMVDDFLLTKNGLYDIEEKLTLLSIGQMIEFLDGYVWDIGYRKMNGELGYWTIDEGRIMQDELVDALWEAVKEVLKEE